MNLLFNKKYIAFFLIAIVATISIIMLQDFLRTYINHSSFYFSESLLFSSFWWLFVTILWLQYSYYKKTKPMAFLQKAALILMPIILHVVLFPSLVFVLSACFYYHTYAFKQTFFYAISEYFYLLMFLYSLPILLVQYFLKNQLLPSPTTNHYTEPQPLHYINSIMVTESNKKIAIATNELNYISASPPYINLHVNNKKHLLNQTLKAMQATLNPDEFVRIHKSTIVNINKVVSCTSRLNGDYDACLNNQEILRISRSFAADFKKIFENTHRVTLKK